MTSTRLSTLPNLDLSSLILNLPGFVIIKDLNSNYLNANLNTLNEFNLKNADHLFGYSDLTIPHPLSKNGQLYRNLDLEVIQTGEPMKGICTFPFQNTILPYHFRKSILKDTHGNKIATYSHAEKCVDPILIQFIHRLIIEHPCKLRSPNATHSFILNKEYRGMQLSPLESNCLFYLIRKKTKSEIANALNLPVRIINLYIENIKTQLKANNILDVLDISIDKSYLNIVPPGIYSQLYHAQNQLFSVNIEDNDHLETTLPPSNLVKFTNRELDCARLLVTGKKIKEIANAHNLSPRTIETHLNNLKMKLDCRDKVELIIKLRNLLLSIK